MRKKQKETPWLNGEGYYDPTAYQALKNIEREENKRQEKVEHQNIEFEMIDREMIDREMYKREKSENSKFNTITHDNNKIREISKEDNHE